MWVWVWVGGCGWVQVTELSLSNNALQELPTGLWLMSSLTRLRLSNNRCAGPPWPVSTLGCQPSLA